jgi:TonB family protein
MLRLSLVAALALAFAAVPARKAAAQAEGEFQPLRAWDAVSSAARTRPSPDSLILDAGSLRSQNLYTDAVFRFEYRLATGDGRGALFVRGAFDEAGRFSGYTVALDSGTGRGQLGAERRVLHEERYDPPSAPVAPGRWVACEVRLEGDRLTVSLDDVLVAIADRLDEQPGLLGFTAAGSGGLELRNVRVALVDPTTGPFGSAVSAEAPGVTKPTLVRRTTPTYPEAMVRERISGIVQLEVVIGPDGRIVHTRITATPHRDLGVAAVECVRQWRFTPATKDGAPVPVVATVDVAFDLKGRPGRPAAPTDAPTLSDWEAEFGTRTTKIDADTLRLERGAIHTPRVFADFVLRFEYRPVAADGAGELLVHTAGYNDREYNSYAIALTAGTDRGQLSGRRRPLQGATFAPRAAAADADTWIPCEIRAEGDRLSVSVDGVVVSTADRLDERFGTIGFRVRRGGFELRRLTLSQMTLVDEIPAGLPTADARGVRPPTAITRREPRYSRAAMVARAQGVAVLEFVIEADGEVGPVRVKSAPHPDLAIASLACLRTWRFEPARKDGTPVAIVATMELVFKLK